jgi:hypothetical protein
MRTLRMRAPQALAVGLLLGLAGCAGEEYPVDVTGSTGPCEEYDTVWSGDPIPGGLPGTVLERKVRCEEVTMSDERLSGTYESAFRCDFAQQGEDVVGTCSIDSTVTNDGGTWQDSGGAMTITAVAGAPATIVEDGVRAGSGDYDGLTFTYHVTGTALGYPWEISGTIDRND